MLRHEMMLTASRMACRWTAVSLAACVVAVAGCGASQTASSAAPTATSPAAARTETATATTTATAARPHATAPGRTPVPGCQSTAGYTAEAFCLLQQAGTRNQAINTDCGPLLTNGLSDPGGHCQNEIAAYTTFLDSAQSDLHLSDLTNVPADVQAPAAYLAGAVRDDLAAARLATTAIDSHDLLGFLRAWGLHGKAGRELQAAAAVFGAR